MRDAERRREISDYYLGISADEITSHLTPATFDLWDSVARYRRELGIGDRWLEVGGGMGDLAAAALDRGYDVLMTDVEAELLDTAAARHPRLGTRLRRADIFDARDVATLAEGGPFSIVAAVGADHPDKQEIDPALLAAGTIVVDVLDQAATMGDLHHAVAAGAVARSDVYAELGEVVAGRKPGRRSAAVSGCWTPSRRPTSS